MRKRKSTEFVTVLAARVSRLLRSVAIVGLLAGVSTTGTIAADDEVYLRGTTGPADAYSTLENSSEPHTIIETVSPGYMPSTEVSDDVRAEQSPYPAEEAVDGLRSTFGYIANNAVGALLFGNKHKAIEDRDVAFQVPDRAPLRQSMLHSVNYDSGLRTGQGSIADTVSSALRGSYASRERLERANAERARMHAAIGNFLPKVEGVAEVNRSRRNSIASGTYDQDVINVGIEASVPIFTSGVNTNTYRQARNVSIAADYSYLAEEHRASLEAVTAHINLRLNRKIENALAENVAAIKRTRVIAQKLFDAGDASKTDIAVAEANVESAKSELDIARRTREETQVDYKSLTGRSAPRKLEIAKTESIIPATLEQAVATAFANNPDLQAARHTAIASEDNARIVRGRFGPQVDAFGRYDKYLYDSIQEDRQDDYTIGVRLRVPLIDFSTVPTIEAARHEAAENGYKALEQRRLLRRQVERQWAGYQSAKRRVTIAQRQLKAVAKALEGTRREYQAGFRSITDVLNEQVKLVRAQITLQTAIHEKMLLAYELAFSTAGPNVQHLASSR